MYLKSAFHSCVITFSQLVSSKKFQNGLSHNRNKKKKVFITDDVYQVSEEEGFN